MMLRSGHPFRRHFDVDREAIRARIARRQRLVAIMAPASVITVTAAGTWIIYHADRLGQLVAAVSS